MTIYTDTKRNTPLAMVVDDDRALRKIMTSALKRSGLDVIEADNGTRGVEQFNAERPDIVLMDVVMPGMDGFEACRQIRQSPEGKYVQILMVTGVEDIEAAEKAFEAGANDFVAKPFNLTMMGQRVQYMLRAGQAFRELHISRSRLAKTQELARIGNWQVDLKTGQFHCSKEACQLLGLDQGARNLTIDHFLGPIVPEDKNQATEDIETALREKKSTTIEYRIHFPGGLQTHILNKSETIFDEQNQPVLMIGIVQDVTQLKKAEEEIRFLAFYDGLTGLANRSLFMDRLDRAIADSTRKKKHFALLFLDLDHFKRINDTLGHYIGVLLLKKVAQSISSSIRITDSVARMKDPSGQNDPFIARLGGDEFIVLITDLETSGYAALIARRLLKAAPCVHRLEGIDVSINTSIGISVFPEDGTQADTLLKNADPAMYHAKNMGRNTYQYFKNSMNKAALERFSMDRDLKKALIKKEFVLYYQPQLRLSDEKIVGAEALIRWNHPRKGMVPPDHFIPIAEESGIILDINQWVFHTACQQATAWVEKNLPPISVAINLSGYKLASQNIIQTIEDALQSINFATKNIEVEITENILMRDTKATTSVLDKIKNLGLKIALDDFGTGYSSLSYLTSFPFDTIKIDRSFVKGCVSNEKNIVIIKAIIAMGHSLGKKIVAEGIETREQYHFMKQYGCDEAQGYYFSPPVPEEEFAVLLCKGHF